MIGKHNVTLMRGWRHQKTKCLLTGCWFVGENNILCVDVTRARARFWILDTWSQFHFTTAVFKNPAMKMRCCCCQATSMLLHLLYQLHQWKHFSGSCWNGQIFTLTCWQGNLWLKLGCPDDWTIGIENHITSPWPCCVWIPIGNCWIPIPSKWSININIKALVAWTIDHSLVLWTNQVPAQPLQCFAMFKPWVRNIPCSLVNCTRDVKPGTFFEIIHLSNHLAIIEMIIKGRRIQMPAQSLAWGSSCLLGSHILPIQAQFLDDIIDEVRLRKVESVVIDPVNLNPKEVWDVSFHSELESNCFHLFDNVLQLLRVYACQDGVISVKNKHWLAFVE